jgi:hypothetical protein
VPDPLALDHALQDHAGEILESWTVRFERAPTRLRRGAAATTYASQAANLIEALRVAASGGEQELRPGAALTRELERSCAFLGGQLASAGSSGFDVAAFLLSLRDAVLEFATTSEAPVVTSLFEWLAVLALDSFATAGILSLQERTTEQLESGTPVVEIAPKVASVLFVGGPTTSTMDGLLSRGSMLAIGIGSCCLIVDVSGLCEQSLKLFPKTIAAFLEREHPPSIEILLVGATRSVSDACGASATRLGRKLSTVERLDSAVEQALDRNGYAIVRRS